MKPSVRLLVVAVTCTVVGCTGPAAPSPTPPTAPGSPGTTSPSLAPSPTPSPTKPTLAMPQRDEDAVAWAEYRSGHVTAEAGITQADKAYVAHAFCSGEGALEYAILVDNVEVSSATVACGQETFNTALTSKEKPISVQLEIQPGQHSDYAFVDIVPDSSA